MPTLTIAPGLFAWTLELEDGTTRDVLASSLDSALNGILPSPVVVATRGEAIGDGSSPALVPPVLGSLVPATAQIGTPGFTLHVHGTGFRQDSVILWNGSPAATTFVSATELTTSIPTTAIYQPGPLPVGARTIGGQDSNVVPFTFTP